MSLIDILAILLIFFIVTTTFKTHDSLIQVNLPKSSEAGEEDNPERRVMLILEKDGQISLEDRVILIESLSDTLRQFRKTRPTDRLELRADEEVPLGQMVKVWDAASRAGLAVDDLPLRVLVKD